MHRSDEGPRRQPRALLALLGVALLLAACSNSEGAGSETNKSSTSTDADVTTTTEVTTTTAEVTTTVAEVGAADDFLRIVAPINCEITKWNTVVNGLVDADAAWPAYQRDALPQAEVAAAAAKESADGLAAVSWPGSVQPRVDGVIADLEGVTMYFESFTDITTVEAFAALDAARPENDDAAAVRELLGLDESDLQAVDYCALASE